ncbi:MAG: hypothetical protein ACYSWQ_14365 [Planctomycetota bacterium]|jgi:hypothetical protein
MKSIHALVVGKVLVLAAGIFISLTISGCGDSVVKDFEANRRRMGDECQRALSQGVAAFTPASQTRTFRPAP